MTLSEEERDRLADVVELQPTKNAELQERWEMESGSEVHQYLETELKDYYYRDEDSMICATPDAVEAVGGSPADAQTVVVSDRQEAILEVLAGPGEDGQSVVSVLHDLREVGRDPSAEEVRSALRTLTDKGVVETIKTTVPTFRLAVERDRLKVQRAEG